MTDPLRVGDLIHGFVGGAFGRDHYSCCRIEAIGTDWVVARPLDSTSGPAFSSSALDEVAKARGESIYPHDIECPDWTEWS